MFRLKSQWLVHVSQSSKKFHKLTRGVHTFDAISKKWNVFCRVRLWRGCRFPRLKQTHSFNFKDNEKVNVVTGGGKKSGSERDRLGVLGKSTCSSCVKVSEGSGGNGGSISGLSSLSLECTEPKSTCFEPNRGSSRLNITRFFKIGSPMLSTLSLTNKLTYYHLIWFLRKLSTEWNNFR